ncbi:MAG: hypothetical protein AAGC81_20450 [Pseudomonadota bacterium]
MSDDDRIVPDFFWVKVEDFWEVAARVVGDTAETWWRWGSRWPLRPGAIKEVGPQVARPRQEARLMKTASQYLEEAGRDEAAALVLMNADLEMALKIADRRVPAIPVAEQDLKDRQVLDRIKGHE